MRGNYSAMRGLKAREIRIQGEAWTNVIIVFKTESRLELKLSYSRAVEQLIRICTRV